MAEATTRRKTPSDSGTRATRAFRSLLVPIDLTSGSDRVLDRVSLLPLAEGARVTLVHVVSGLLTKRDQRIAQRDAGKRLGDEARHLHERLDKKVRVEALVRVGSAAKEIAATATEIKPELLVMGRGGERALRDAFLGSTAERVVRQARRPVLVVRLAARGAYKRPALALDRDQSAHEIVRTMLRVLQTPRPRVDVIHAFDIPYQGMIYPSLSEDQAEATKNDLRSNATRELKRLLAAALSKAGVRPEQEPSWKLWVLDGSPQSVVEKVTKKADTDLLVLGTRCHTGASYVLLGTVAGNLLRAAKCDVLMVPPTAARE